MDFTRFKFYRFKSVTSGFCSLFSPLILAYVFMKQIIFVSGFCIKFALIFFFFLERVERAGKILFRKVTICLQLNYFHAQKQMENIWAKSNDIFFLPRNRISHYCLIIQVVLILRCIKICLHVQRLKQTRNLKLLLGLNTPYRASVKNNSFRV